MFRACLVATSLILAAGPTRIALMIPASADSSAPRNELSSQGCTTIVVTEGTFLAAALRRSYFAPGCFAAASAGMALISGSEILDDGETPSDLHVNADCLFIGACRVG